MWSEREEERTEVTIKEEKAKDKHEKYTKREMTHGIYSGGGVRCLRSYAFVGVNHLLKTILFH
jgi:hypothetical protein